MATTPDDFANLDGVLAADARAAAHYVPPPDMLPSVWAEANIRIPVGNAIPGPINFANAPMQRGILDAVKEPGMQRMDLMLGAQLGKTTVLQCLVGYHIKHEPKSQILTQPSEGDMATFLETKLKPMLEANPAIAACMAAPRGREGVNNSRMASYIGGWLMYGWAGSPKTARGRSAPILLMDEVDGYQVTPEGDYTELLAQRAATFGDEQRQVRSSTPVDMATSRIYAGWLLGDQRRYYVRCPDCEELQYFRWESVRWEGRKSTNIEDAEKDLDGEHEPESARYCCASCGTLWDDGQRIAAIRQATEVGGGWIAARPFKGHASFHAPEMASTFRRLRDIVRSYLNKLALDDLQSFVNVSLGWPYESGEKVDPDSLLARREVYAAQVPAGGVFLTAGVDMQADRLECEVVAWGEGEESWSIEYKVFWGDPLGDEVWQDLEDYLGTSFEHEYGGLLAISATCIDTGGTSGMTAAAYDWLKGKTGRKIFGIKGIAGWGRAIVETPKRKQSGKRARKVDLFLVAVDEAKLVTQRRLAVLKPGPGHMHFPDDREPEWFKQLTAERLNVRYVKGQPVREWIKPDRARNEALDCRNYAYAALKIMNPSFRRLAERLGMSRNSKKSTENAAIKRRPEEIARNPPKQEQTPQEEASPPADNNAASRPKPRRKFGSKSAGNWATKW